MTSAIPTVAHTAVSNSEAVFRREWPWVPAPKATLLDGAEPVARQSQEPTEHACTSQMDGTTICAGYLARSWSSVSQPRTRALVIQNNYEAE